MNAARKSKKPPPQWARKLAVDASLEVNGVKCSFANQRKENSVQRYTRIAAGLDSGGALSALDRSLVATLLRCHAAFEQVLEDKIKPSKRLALLALDYIRVDKLSFKKAVSQALSVSGAGEWRRGAVSAQLRDLMRLRSVKKKGLQKA